MRVRGFNRVQTMRVPIPERVNAICEILVECTPAEESFWNGTRDGSEFVSVLLEGMTDLDQDTCTTAETQHVQALALQALNGAEGALSVLCDRARTEGFVLLADTLMEMTSLRFTTPRHAFLHSILRSQILAAITNGGFGQWNTRTDEAWAKRIERAKVVLKLMNARDRKHTIEAFQASADAKPPMGSQDE